MRAALDAPRGVAGRAVGLRRSGRKADPSPRADLCRRLPAAPIRLDRRCRDPEGGAELSVAEVGVADVGGDAPGGSASGLGRGLRHQDRELVAADAEAVIGQAGGLEDLGDGAEDLVAGGVAEAVVDPLEAVEVKEAEGEGTVVAGGAGELDPEAFIEGAAVGQTGEPVAAATQRLGLVEVGVGDVGGDQLAQQFERLHVAVVEVVGQRRVDLEHTDRLLAVGQRHAEHRSGVDAAAGLGVDPRILGGVVAAQHLSFEHAAPGKARPQLQPRPQVRSRLAAGHRVDHLLALGQLDHSGAGAGQLPRPVGDQLHDRLGFEVAGRDLRLGADDRPQLFRRSFACHASKSALMPP